MAPVRVAGVDGTRAGWVAVVLDPDGGQEWLLLPHATSFTELGEVAVIGVDVPIGFGPRAADAAARAYLRGAASTVFSVPSREVLARPFGPGLGVSAQAHAIGPRILHVTELAARDPRLHEVHPEASFRAMNHDAPLGHGKRSAAGALARIDLLREHGIVLRNIDAVADCPLDDVLDAAAAAWSARRIVTGRARCFPDPAQVRDGRTIAIWC